MLHSKMAVWGTTLGRRLIPKPFQILKTLGFGVRRPWRVMPISPGTSASLMAAPVGAMGTATTSFGWCVADSDLGRASGFGGVVPSSTAVGWRGGVGIM